jgi:hypothetical protein
MTTARQLETLECRVDRLARCESGIYERLTYLCAELEQLLRVIDRVTGPPRRRRRPRVLPPGVISLKAARDRPQFTVIRS